MGLFTLEELGVITQGLSSLTHTWTSSSFPKDGVIGERKTGTREFKLQSKASSLPPFIANYLQTHSSFSIKCYACRTVYYGEYKCSGPGANSTARVAWAHMMTDEEAEPFIDTHYVDGDDWLIN